MAYMKFKKDDEPSIKKDYIPNSVKVNERHEKIHEEHIKQIQTHEHKQKSHKNHMRIWKIISIIETIIIVCLLIKGI